MTQSEHNDFLERNVKEILTFKKGETVVRQGDPITFVMLLVEGSVRTELITQEGNILNIDTLEAVIPLAPAFIYVSPGKYNHQPGDIHVETITHPAGRVLRRTAPVAGAHDVTGNDKEVRCPPSFHCHFATQYPYYFVLLHYNYSILIRS